MASRLPSARARIADESGVPTAEFYRFLAALQRANTEGANPDTIAAINVELAQLSAAVDALPEVSFPTLIAQLPLKSDGFLQNGYAKLVWAGTTSDVPEGSRLYFTDPRVYAAVKAMLAGSAVVSIVADDATQTVTIETKSFEFYQPTPSAEWSIAHNLGKFPTVAVTDSAGNAGIGSVHYVDANNLVLSFGAPFAGTAYLN